MDADEVRLRRDLVARVPDPADTSQAQRGPWARWPYALYPESADGRLGSVEPDLLAETHIVGQLTAAPDLAEACLRDLTASQAERALKYISALARGMPQPGMPFLICST